MTHHLCVSVTLLDPLFHGKGDSDAAHPDGRPEWPPSPMRLFQALLAGARGGCRARGWSNAQADAFRWLERLEPPRIVGPNAQPAASYTFFVPNNDADKKFDRQDRLTSKVARPMRLGCDVENGDGATVHYLWRIPDGDWPTASTHADLLCREARHVVALGWGIDQAVADARILADGEAASLTGKQWRAWRTLRRGSPTWRVPVEGSLDDLDGTYASFVRRIDSETYSPSRKVSRFDTVHYLGHTVLPPRPYAAFELPEGTGFRTGDVAMAAAMLRSLTCRCAMSDTHDFPGGSEIYVAGHVEQQDDTPARFSYLPLPTIGREHADAMVRRMLVAEPMNGDGTHAQWAQQRLLNATLRDQDGCDRAVLLDLWRSSTPRMLERYVGEAQIWCTVTPVILPGFDDAKQRKAERLLLAAVTQAGIPISAIDGFVLRKAPFWSGAMHPRRYNVPAYLRHLPAWHVWVRFCEAVPGPLAIGAGRHVGLGLFAVAEEAAERSNEVEIRAARSRGTNLGLDSIRARWRGSGALGFQRRCA